MTACSKCILHSLQTEYILYMQPVEPYFTDTTEASLAAKLLQDKLFVLYFLKNSVSKVENA